MHLTPPLIALIYDVLIILTLLVLIFRKGSWINNGFKYDLSQLSLIRQTLTFINMNYKLVVSDDFGKQAGGGDVLNLMRETMMNRMAAL